MKSPNKRSNALTELTATAAVRAMRDGDMTAEAYAGALLKQAALETRLNAFVTLEPGTVLEAARQADLDRANGRTMGMLHGLPIPVKDSVNTRAFPTSNGTRALREFTPRHDATIIKRLLEQGALIMGKTNLTELSFGWTSNNGTFGAVHNPRDLLRVPGGSSGGSAAAVAANIAPIAIAADTLGSIRVPAAFCGLAGLRASFGRYPDEGVFSLTDNKLDQVGAVTRSVVDLALFDAAVSGDTEPLTAMSLKGVRIGVAHVFHQHVDAEIERVIHTALQRLEASGAVIVETELPESMIAAFDIAATIMLYEAANSIERFLAVQNTGVSFDHLLAQVADGMNQFFSQAALPPGKPSRQAYETMLKKQVALKSEVKKYFAKYNLLALGFPAVGAFAPKIGEEHEVEVNGRKLSFFQAFGQNTALSSSAGIPGLVLPAGFSRFDRLPVGLELVGLRGEDRTLLSLGLAIEQALS